MLDGRVWWPLFPLLLLVVVVCLTWALVAVVRHGERGKALWLQIGAFTCYFLAAVSAIASERGAVSAHLHRPFSLLTQVCLVLALIHHWKGENRPLVRLNAVAWAGILSDAALHLLVVRPSS
jgi:hypothetical protein